MELVLNPKKKFDQIGKGYICLKEASFNTPASLFLLNKDNENSSPEILFSLEGDICIEKVKERLYDITCFNDRNKIIELIFDDDVDNESLKTLDAMVLSLQSNNEQTLEYELGENSRVAEIIEKGGVIVSKGIDLAAYWTAIGIVKGGQKLKNSIEPLEEAVVVTENWDKTLSVAKSTSSSIKKSTKAVSQVVEDTLTFVIDKTSGDSLKGKTPVLRSASRASIRILDSLDDAADHILKKSGQTASDIIEHRYGNEATEAAKKGGSALKNSYKAHRSVRRIGRRSVKKAVGNVTAKRNGYVPSEESKIDKYEQPVTVF
jgi:hypothetical protein